MAVDGQITMAGALHRREAIVLGDAIDAHSVRWVLAVTIDFYKRRSC